MSVQSRVDEGSGDQEIVGSQLIRRKQFSIARLMIGVAVVAFVLTLLRYPNAWMLPRMRRDRVELDLSLGEKALHNGQLAKARRYFEDAVWLDPRSYECYTWLAQTASVQGDYVQAHRRLGQAIDAARAAGVKGMTVPTLYSRRAMVLVKLSRHRESEASRFCRQACDDLSTARRSGERYSQSTAFLIEKTTAEVEQRMGELAAKEGDSGIAGSHYSEARCHAKAALTIRAREPSITSLLREIEVRLSAFDRSPVFVEREPPTTTSASAGRAGSVGGGHPKK